MKKITHRFTAPVSKVMPFLTLLLLLCFLNVQLSGQTTKTLFAWGGNNYGQLGDGTLTNRTSPVQIGIDNDWQQITAGLAHTLALKNDGSLWAWGDNGKGQLGDGMIRDKTIPFRIGSDNDWQQITA